MIYTAHLNLTPEQRNRASSARSFRKTAASARRYLRRIVDAISEGVQKSRAALAAHNGFDAQ